MTCLAAGAKYLGSEVTATEVCAAAQCCLAVGVPPSLKLLFKLLFLEISSQIPLMSCTPVQECYVTEDF